MTIKIFTDRIDIGDFTLFEGNGGVQFDGVARAENFLGNQGFQGTVAGFVSGGYSGGNPQLANEIDRFPFATDTNATDIGDITARRNDVSGQSSSTHGYTSGGGLLPIPAPVMSNVIDKFAFSNIGNATDVGDLTQARRGVSGQSSSVSGYVSGGSGPVNTINKFPFTTDTNATDIGDLTQARNGAAGQSSTTFGYTSGGAAPPGRLNTIDKFPFAADTDATNVGDLTQVGLTGSTGQSSTISGYTTGRYVDPGVFNTIDKFPFSTDNNATDVGDLSAVRWRAAGQSSTTHGYTSGGMTPDTRTIDKFPFATDTNASSVGNLNSRDGILNSFGQAGTQF